MSRLDDVLCLTHDRLHLLRLIDLRSHVDGILDDLVGLAVGIEYRVVAGFDPDFPSILADPLVLAGVELAAAQFLPELPIFVARASRGSRRTCCDAGP